MKTPLTILQCGCNAIISCCRKSFKKKAGKLSFLTILLLFLYSSISSSTFAQWTQVGTQLTGLTGGSPRISVVDSNIVWVAGGVGSSPKVYRTTDGGLHWVSLPTSGLPYFLTAIAAKDSLAAFVADVGGPTYNGGNAKLYKTTDAGLNWTVIDSTGGTTGFYDDIQFSKSNPQFGIAMSDPASGAGGPFILNKTTDGGNTWVQTNPPGVTNSFGLYYVSYPIDPMFYGFASLSLTTLLMTSYTTNNGGVTWTLGNGDVSMNNWGDIVFNNDKQHGVMLGNDWPNIKVSSNGGNDWTTINANTDISGFSTASWVSGTNTVFICASISPSSNKIIRSDDNGLTWQQQSTPDFGFMELDNVRYGNTTVGFSISSEGYVIKSTQNVSVIPVELTSFTASVNNEGVVILKWSTATEVNNQLFEIERKSEDGQYETIGSLDGYGTTTEPQEYSYIDNTVRTGTFFYRLKQIDFGGQYEYSNEIEVEVNGPLSFALEQNYPNPFNPSTKIKYSVPENGNVKLSVYNLVGEVVSVLVNESVNAGFYEVSFNASSLPSGTYFYSLKKGNSIQTKKMVLLK